VSEVRNLGRDLGERVAHARIRARLIPVIPIEGLRGDSVAELEKAAVVAEHEIQLGL
jgi:hypothetical protein